MTSRNAQPRRKRCAPGGRSLPKGAVAPAINASNTEQPTKKTQLRLAFRGAVMLQAGARPVKNGIPKVLLFDRLCGYGFFEAFGPPNELDDLPQSVGEFREILLVKENLMPVIRNRSVGRSHFATFGNRQKIVVGARRTDIEEIGPTSGLHGFRKNLITVLFIFSTGLRIR